LPGEDVLEVVLLGALEDRGDERVVDLRGGAARVEKTYQHMVSP
jgi:hypothetical protein